jgi:hypothetical protein
VTDEEKIREVEVRLGQMAVTACICCSDSDSFSDYYAPHWSLTPRFALLVLPAGRQTQARARRALKDYPFLSAYNFSWHTENYSMGHGNYLEQVDTFELPDWVNNPKYKQAFKLSAPSYNTHPTQGHWEIEFSQPYRSAEVFIRCSQSWEQFEEECRIIAVEQGLDRCLL